MTAAPPAPVGPTAPGGALAPGGSPAPDETAVSVGAPRRPAGGPSIDDLVRPAYGSASLADLLPAVLERLGVPGPPSAVAEPGLQDWVLPAADRYVVVLVDGLGERLLRRHAGFAPWFASHLGSAGGLTAGVPSTTATSLTSLGTGLPPGGHGIVGYTSRVPQTGELLNALTWESDLVPRAFQGRPTVFERARDAGVAVSSVAVERFRASGLTEAALRGPRFVGFENEADEDRRIDLIVAAAGRGSRSLVYAYERELDHTGHTQGSASLAWRTQLDRIDAMCERLRDALPPEVVLLVTGDHGMVDVPTAQQIVAEDHADLMAGVTVLGGEGRFRHLYVDHDRPGAVAARWQDHLGPRAWVRTRDDAVADGWFGPVRDDLLERWGHVLVAMREPWAVMTRQFPREMTLVGMHGSLTADEMQVPLLIA